MADKQEIEIFISEDGRVKYHIKGIKGKKCVDAAKAALSPLGQIKDMEYTSEYYETEEKSKTRQKLGQ
ncbi:MAG: DUF2997 domain-containing protein [Candidatus Omnitrophica bacterium]|nr:DUF2997 domain-containing protein [Candidatus Omnitrophota bacterium]